MHPLPHIKPFLPKQSVHSLQISLVVHIAISTVPTLKICEKQLNCADVPCCGFKCLWMCSCDTNLYACVFVCVWDCISLLQFYFFFCVYATAGCVRSCACAMQISIDPNRELNNYSVFYKHADACTYVMVK